MIEQSGTLEISRGRLANNLRAIASRLAKGVKICATLKADAYGHGAAMIWPLLKENGVEWVAVYSLAEAVDVGWGGAILMLAPFVVVGREDDATGMVLAHFAPRLRLNVTDERSARQLSQAVVASGVKERLNVHIQVDTGLARGGVEMEDAARLAEIVAGLRGLQLEGMFAHPSHGDVPGHESVRAQVRGLQSVAEQVKRRHPGLIVHAQNSGAVWNVGEGEAAGLDMARVGIALYGLQPSTADPIPDLQPIARVTAPILAIHEVPANTGVGYGHTFITRRPSRLAIVPVGYADGYPRLLSSHPAAIAQLHDTDVPVIARVSMDQVILDITGLPAAGLGDTVTLISWDPEKSNSLDRMADAIGTIGYELATHLVARLNRVIVP